MTQLARGSGEVVVQTEGLPPHDVSAEEAVIAALLLDSEAYQRIKDMLTEADFFREQHGWVWHAATDLFTRGEEITIPTITHELSRAGVLDRMGGEPALIEIAGRHFTSQGVEAHARMVLRDSTYRNLIQVAGAITRIAYEGSPDADRVVSAAVNMLTAVVQDYSARAANHRVSTVKGFRL